MLSKPRVLTEPFIKALKPAPAGKRYAVSDALVPGLQVRVTENGSKTFGLWRRIDPRAASASFLALGKVGELSLADARTKARDWIAKLAAGNDPREAQRAARANTVAAAVELFVKRHVAGQRRAADAERAIRNEIVSRWGNMPLSAVTRRMVIEMVDEIVDRGARSQARNVLGFAKVFFGRLVEKDMLEASPADRVSALRLIGPKVPRERVLDDAEICALWDASDRLGYPLGPYLRMLLLTGQRKTEVAHARWREINLKNKTWTIPPERFKSNAVHVVPLSDAMVELLETLPRWKGGDFLFSTTGGPTPINGFANGKRRIDKAMGNVAHWRLHDVRRTVRTRLSELHVRENVAEMVIGHSKKGLARVYDQHRYANEMRAALQAWALRLQGIVSPPPANVVPFAAKTT